MCGITLIYHVNESLVDEDMLNRMTRVLHHRGPDGRGTFISKHVGFGHTRLSIVDLEGGAQPMHTSDGRYVVTYNGEIYNFESLRESLIKEGVSLISHSDSEVLLALYQQKGPDCVHQLRGMFSFAILDTTNSELFIARDRLGIKPLFYHWDGTTLLAASEMKSIFASDIVTPKFNNQSIRNHFTYQFSISPYTIFEDVFELPPGHTMTLNIGGQPVISQYWDLEFPQELYFDENDDDESNEQMLEQMSEQCESDDVWVERFRAALNSSTASHTIGDVPIGTYLSGGIDSSATSLLLKQHYPVVPQSYSIHFTNPESDESFAYKAVAEHLELPNEELVIDDEREEGFLGIFEQCLYHLEQPQRMAVDIPHFMLSDFVRNRNCKVVYTGDGADEILGGYDCFRQDSMRCWGNEQDNEQARAAIYLNQYTEYFSEKYMSLLLELHAPERQDTVYDDFGTYPAWYDFWQILIDSSKALFTDKFLAETDKDTQMPELIAKIKPQIENRHPLNQSMYIETKTRLPGWILWKSDRLSMAHGVEARVPFMDHPLAELAAKVPCQLKLNGMNEKYILKKIMQPELPELPGDYKKRAFYTPIREWFMSDKRLVETQKYLCAEALEEAGIFKLESVQKIIDELVAAPSNSDMNTNYEIMKWEWLFMLVLSTQILHCQFIKKTAECFRV